jgi:hypothetical protein
LVISASKLTVLGGEKGSQGCERKLVGQYYKGMKQSSSAALEFGSDLHEAAEELQATGEVPDPEGDVGVVLRAGAHLLGTCGKLLVEHEHRGFLPDGTPYVAFLDGQSPDGGDTSCVVIQDLKSTSNPRYALVPGDSEYGIQRNIQAKFYAWILLCDDPHWFAPRLAHGTVGPQQWKIWDPVERGALSGRLRWLYFLTKGVARAWDVSDFVSPEQAAAFMAGVIMPLVERIKAAHSWCSSHPEAELKEFDRNLSACSNVGRWCGVGERDACDFAALGTPVLDLVQLRVRPKLTAEQRLAALRPQSKPTQPKEPQQMTTPAQATQERLAALRARTAAGAAPLVVTPPAAAPTPAPAPAAQETPAASPPAASAAVPAEAPQSEATASTATTGTDAAPISATEAPAAPAAPRRPGRPRTRPPAALTGAGINPPEGQQALALLTEEGPSAAPAPSAEPVSAPPAETPAPLGLARLVSAIASVIPAGTTLMIPGAGK